MAAAMVGSLTFAIAQQSQDKPLPHSGPAETGLIGISLYDPGIKIINKFGSPDEIQGLASSGQAIGGAPSGGAAGGRGGPALGKGAAGGGGAFPGTVGKGGGGAAASADIDTPDPLGNSMIGDPFGMTGETYWQQRPGNLPPGVPPGAFGPPPGYGQPGQGGRPSAGAPGVPSVGRPAGAGGGRPAAGGGAAGFGGGGNGSRVLYTRWVYKRDNCRYAFVLDKFNRVVQIEAVGLTSSRVKTKRGLTFGASFAQIIKKHSAPDGYEISGDNLVVRYLVRDHVAFRLSRLDAKKPQVVTGIVVAAGKE